MGCDARTEGQEVVCHSCGIRWDLNDKDKQCGGEILSREKLTELLKQLRDRL
jgi:predicted metal-binding protein